MPTRDEKRAIVEHLRYEVQMLRSATYALTSTIPLGFVLQNALLEAVALHTRNLVDFFYLTPNPRHPDDVLARDLVRDLAMWEAARPVKSGLLQEAEVKADKQVAHLTYARLGLTEEQRKWHYVALLGEVEALLSLFLTHADTDLVPQGSL